MCIEYHIKVNMYHVSAQGVDEHMINVHYYYYYCVCVCVCVCVCCLLYTSPSPRDRHASRMPSSA